MFFTAFLQAARRSLDRIFDCIQKLQDWFLRSLKQVIKATTSAILIPKSN